MVTVDDSTEIEKKLKPLKDALAEYEKDPNANYTNLIKVYPAALKNPYTFQVMMLTHEN